MASGRYSTARKSPLRRLALVILVALGVMTVVVQTAPGVTAALMPLRTQAGDILVTPTSREQSPEPGLVARLLGHGAKERRIRELEARVQELSRYEAAARSMSARLEAYEVMLAAMGEPPARGATARIISETDGPFSETLLANAGRAQGVEEDFVALNEGGLVGRVIQIGERSSRILLVTDFNSRVPVMGETSGVRAIVFGDRDGLGTPADLPEADDFIAGERILTSGEAGLFPRGYVVGWARAKGDAWRVEFSKAETRGGFVRLIPPQSIPTPEAQPAAEPPPASEAGTLSAAQAQGEAAGGGEVNEAALLGGGRP